jgi:DNA-binding MurR/RpiR family transcriptional regulator
MAARSTDGSATPPASVVLDRIRTNRDSLTPAERKVASQILDDPELVAFGTVAELADLAGTSGPTVVRLANRLGFSGFKELQQAVRDELSQQLRPAASRIRSRSAAGPIETAAEVEGENVRGTLESLDPGAVDGAVAALADDGRSVFVVPSEQLRPIGTLLATELGILRGGVRLVVGSEFRVASLLGEVRPGDVVVVMDLHRYERWILQAHRWAGDAGAAVLAVTDGEMSPLAGDLATFVARAEATGPFDSLVGVHAVVNVLVAGTAQRLRKKAGRRLDRLETVWNETGVLEP